MIRNCDKCITGHYSQIEEKLCNELRSFSRRYKHVYVGMTSRPKERADEHERNAKMEGVEIKEFKLLWKTTSRQNAKYAERKMIEYVKSKENERILLLWKWPDVGNTIVGGGGRKGKNPTYHYVYVRGR